LLVLEVADGECERELDALRLMVGVDDRDVRALPVAEGLGQLVAERHGDAETVLERPAV